MAQSDFCSLTFSSDEDDFELFEKSVDHSSLSRSGSLSKIVGEATDYVPKNYIQPEALALIAAWEAAMNMKARTKISDVDSNGSQGSNMTEDQPMSPPKRFYLTSWRSIVKRVLQQV
jgi:hypothetical protein